MSDQPFYPLKVKRWRADQSCRAFLVNFFEAEETLAATFCQVCSGQFCFGRTFLSQNSLILGNLIFITGKNFLSRYEKLRQIVGQRIWPKGRMSQVGPKQFGGHETT
jgi:hypothetical protein